MSRLHKKNGSTTSLVGKWIAFFGFMFLVSTILSSIMENGGGMVVTRTTAATSATEVASITVTSTEGYLSADYIVIGDETILYAAIDATHFKTLTRAQFGSTAAVHASGTNVYTQNASVINQGLGFNLQVETASAGVFSLATIPFKFFKEAIPRMMTSNFSFLQGEMGIIGYFMAMMNMGFLFALCLAVIYAIKR